MYADKMLAGSVALIAAFWVAICAAAPEVIWQGLRIAVGHLTRADLLSALLLGLILAFFVEPLLRRTGDFFGPSRRASAEERRNPLFTAGLSLAFALVSVCVLDATSAFVSGRADTIGEPSGLAAAIALTTAWSIGRSRFPSLGSAFAIAGSGCRSGSSPAPTNPTPLAAMVHRLATPHGKKLYARRKHTPEPGFGIIKSVLGFRQFLLRGLDKVRGEWSLVTMACNMKRIFALATR